MTTYRLSIPCYLLSALLLLHQNHHVVSGFTVVTRCGKRSSSTSFTSAAASIATTTTTTTTEADNTASSSSSSSSSSTIKEQVLKQLSQVQSEANQYAEMFDLSPADAAFHALFLAIAKSTIPLGLKGQPFVLRQDEIQKALNGQATEWRGFFTMPDLEKALEDDFLDAARGSTDNRKGWQITDVSQPRGESFEEARMTFDDVKAALEKGTVIMNAAGAHVPKLARPSLACTDATYLPCALNLYVTDMGKRTSAPPHTDKQDVVVVQTAGRKYWKVYSVPNPALKPMADVFARGKMEDSLPLYSLESDLGCQLLIETTLNPGDVMFCPAGFPHTTGTVVDDDAPLPDSSSNNDDSTTSIHLTLGIDHHIWELDYLSARRLALRRAGVVDSALGQTLDSDNRYVGKANELPADVRNDLFAELPIGLLHDDEEISNAKLEIVIKELERISKAVDIETASQVDPAVWRETAERVRQQGKELLETHRDMYLAAIEEGRKREAEEAMTAHLDKNNNNNGKSVRRVMSPERIQRLSLFRVKTYFDRIDKSKKDLNEWSYAGKTASVEDGGAPALPTNWAFTMPVKVGDQVEADLGGAFFPATVTRASGGTYDVSFFDGDKETNLERSMLKLLTPPNVPAATTEVDTSSMTPKQLKRWKKQQEKLAKKN